jgi:hypothetical protein
VGPRERKLRILGLDPEVPESSSTTRSARGRAATLAVWIALGAVAGWLGGFEGSLLLGLLWGLVMWVFLEVARPLWRGRRRRPER